jgi:hypothetical protein
MIVILAKTNKSKQFYEFGTYKDLDDFIDNFPYAERQCIIQIERDLKKNNTFFFSEIESHYSFQLLII